MFHLVLFQIAALSIPSNIGTAITYSFFSVGLIFFLLTILTFVSSQSGKLGANRTLTSALAAIFTFGIIVDLLAFILMGIALS